MNIMGTIWKGARAWLITTVVVIVLVLAVTLVATQNAFIYSTINSVFGGEKSKVVSGDPSQYEYYTVNADDFRTFDPTTELKNKDDALADANLLNERIAEEGIVLLKNGASAESLDDDVLPLADGSKISVFGKNSVNIVYGGSGSSDRSGSDVVDLHAGLANAGFDVNPTLKSFYESGESGRGRGSSPEMGDIVYGFATGETPQNLYTDEVRASYDEYSDAAVVVISRIGGEGYDLPRTMAREAGGNVPVTGANVGDHYLQLDKNERAMITDVCNNFDKVVLVINCSAPMELGFVEETAGIDAALWIGNPGGSGLNALGRVLSGDVAPSGRTVDIYPREFENDPTWQNFGNNLTDGGNEYTVGGAGQGYYYTEYEEGIYYGYRYYETRAYDEGEEWYAENVVYPYGYGLSYTDFTWEITNASPADMSALDPDGSVTVTVDVTNNGDVAAKDVVQLYYSAPYYNGEIEKSHVVLGDFAKTELIPAGETRSVTLSIDVRDMASYDYADANISGDPGWELDASSASSGYSIFLGRNSHDAWAGEDADDLTLTYSSAFHSYDTDVGGEVENRFDDVSGHIETYLSRSDWDFTFPTMPTADDREVTSEFIASLTWTENDEEQPYHTTETFTQGAETELKLYDFIAFEGGVVTVDYDDPRWEELISSLSLEEMAALIGQGNYKTNAIESIDLPLTTMPDGPAGFTAFMGDPSVYGTCFYASECVIGATYNKDLAHDMGIMIGIEGIIGNEAGDGRPYSGWYAPAVNIHRSQFGGRNWEYYSEDPYHSGAMAANVIAGAQSKGVACFLKHFALNEQETNRDTNGVLTWANEQAIREIYLKPFEMAVKDAETVAVMSSFNRIGTTWAGGSYELLTEILRNEWGFKGTVITDYNLSDYMLADQMIRAGGDLNLTQDKRPTTSNASSTQIAMMRRAVKNILYTVARSNAMNGHGDGVVWGIGMPTWVVIVIWVDIAIAAALAVWGFFAIRKALRKAKSAERGEMPAPGEKQ